MPDSDQFPSPAPGRYTILADHGSPEHFRSVRRRIDPQWPGLESTPLRWAGKALRAGIRGLVMYARSLRAPDPAVVVTYGSSASFVFAALQHCFRLLRKPRVHVVFDLLLDAPRGGPWRARDCAKAWIFNRAVTAAVIWGKSDLDLFATAHGLDRRKLRFHPYHITLDDLGVPLPEPRDDGYVFCGGNVGRDFDTVIDALGPTGIPTFIATQVPGVAGRARPYPSITVRGLTPREFRDLLARSTLVLEAHAATFFRTAGHQTMLNAMYLGKPVVLCDRRSADGYVRDGVEGFVRACGDVAGAREAVLALWHDRSLRERMAARARKRARRPLYSTVGHMQSIYNLAIRLDTTRCGLALDGHRLSIYGQGVRGSERR